MAKKKILAEHLKVSTLKERYWIPQHDKRRTSKKFRENKKFLRDDVKLACWICGKKQSKQRPLEVHHIFEWAMWNALDRKRVTRILKVLDFMRMVIRLRRGIEAGWIKPWTRPGRQVI